MPSTIAKVPITLPARFIVDLEDGTLTTEDGVKFGVVITAALTRNHNPIHPYEETRLGSVNDLLELRLGTSHADETLMHSQIHKPKATRGSRRG